MHFIALSLAYIGYNFRNRIILSYFLSSSSTTPIEFSVGTYFVTVHHQLVEGYKTVYILIVYALNESCFETKHVEKNLNVIYEALTLNSPTLLLSFEEVCWLFFQSMLVRRTMKLLNLFFLFGSVDHLNR